MNNKKSILLIGGNYFPEPTGIGKYNGEMIDWLSDNDYECGVVTTYPYYPHWKIQPPYSGKSFWFKTEQKRKLTKPPIYIYRCPHFVPSNPSGSKRVLSDLSFFFSASIQVIRLLFRKKYDYVMVVAPPFHIGILGLMYKKIKKARLIYHIQDLQIDAAIEMGMIRSRPIIRMIYSLERYILRNSDIVSSISIGMIQKIKGKLDREIFLFPNWTDTRAFFPIPVKGPLLTKFNFSSSDKIVLYSGGIGEKQGLQSMLHSAKELREDQNLKFIICGSGPYKEKLEGMAKEMNLDNLTFLPLQNIQQFNELLNMASVHLVLQKKSENELFMPSKLTTILSVGGLVVVAASTHSNLYNLIAEKNVGFAIEPENDLLLTNTIKMAVAQNHDEIRQHALEYADAFLKMDNVLSVYFDKISVS